MPGTFKMIPPITDTETFDTSILQIAGKNLHSQRFTGDIHSDKSMYSQVYSLLVLSSTLQFTISKHVHQQNNEMQH